MFLAIQNIKYYLEDSHPTSPKLERAGYLLCNMVAVNGNSTTLATSPKYVQVCLVPCDPDSTQHAQRLYEQRVAYGWKQEMIGSWQVLQREGKIAIHWVVGYWLLLYHMSWEEPRFLILELDSQTKERKKARTMQLTSIQILSENNPEKEVKLAQHVIQYPGEKESILDRAMSVGGKSRTRPQLAGDIRSRLTHLARI